MVVLLLGIGAVTETIVGDGKIPEPIQLGRFSGIRAIAHTNSSGTISLRDEVSVGEQWDALQPTLKVLHAVAPHVEEWVLQQHADGMINFAVESKGFICTFDCISRELTIYPAFWSEKDGVKASILAHEWRHSRQNPQKFVKYVLSYVFTRELNDELVENDAYLYEREVYEAIYGSELDRRYELQSDEHRLPVGEVARRKGCLIQIEDE